MKFRRPKKKQSFLPLWKADFPERFSFATPLEFPFQYEGIIAYISVNTKRAAKLSLVIRCTQTHTLPTARPSHIPVCTRWFASFVCRVKGKFRFPCLDNIFPVFSLIAWNNKKFLSFEDDPLVIVGSHSKRISSFSKQRPRSFTYIVLLPYFRAAGRRKENKKHSRSGFSLSLTFESEKWQRELSTWTNSEGFRLVSRKWTAEPSCNFACNLTEGKLNQAVVESDLNDR